MRSTNNDRADEVFWDGSRKGRRAPRFLRINQESPTRLLRAAQTGRCTACGNRVEWYEQPDGRAVSLHPQDLPATVVPCRERWLVHAGLAQPTADGTGWCRIRHHAVCPATPHDHHRGDQLDRLRRTLAVNTRRLTESGALAPHTTSPPPPAPGSPARPVVHLLYLRYLAPGPLERLRCVAQTRARRRCPHPVLDPDAPAGTWTLLPLHSNLDCHQPRADSGEMAVYDLTDLPYAEQVRWHAQRCTTHAATPAAADTARTGWELFDPRAHHEHVHSRLPHHPGYAISP